QNRAGAPVDFTRLNDCETDGTMTYYQAPDVASNGTLSGIYVSISMSQALRDRCGASNWPDITVAPTTSTTLASGAVCSSFTLGGSGPILGLNTGDTDPNRGWCPNTNNYSTGGL